MLTDLSVFLPGCFFLVRAGCCQREHHHCPSIDRQGMFIFVLH